MYIVGFYAQQIYRTPRQLHKYRPNVIYYISYHRLCKKIPNNLNIVGEKNIAHKRLFYMRLLSAANFIQVTQAPVYT